jgi:malate/lactate dehydrogenase
MVGIGSLRTGDPTDGDTDLFNTNASIVRDLAKAAAEHSPDANILIISNPVRQTNS